MEYKRKYTTLVVESNDKQKMYTPLMVDIRGLCAISGLSKNKAMELGEQANAVVHLGIRRTLYNVQAIQYFINSRTGVQDDN